MNINENAVLKISKNIEIQVPVERVWDLQANIDQWPKWHPEITYAKLATSLEPGKTFVWKSSGFKLSHLPSGE
ncbi:SRPBCC family protein [Halioxenophilus aromaticivorans]|uniref:Polyketide cyclase/dehydrase n=1 Tax=Halioxenophilus aromaticivorans TaxID=1306992 RepID=A0AAV3TXG0_9ALTE